MNKFDLALIIFACERDWSSIGGQAEYLIKSASSYFLAGDNYTQKRILDIYEAL